mgnify:CR=1 FL=1
MDLKILYYSQTTFVNSQFQSNKIHNPVLLLVLPEGGHSEFFLLFFIILNASWRPHSAK